jgi:hypothetical protein
MWYHLVDGSGTHWVINPTLNMYFLSTAVDGSAPISLHMPLMQLSFIVTAMQFGSIVGALPAANEVDLYG